MEYNYPKAIVRLRVKLNMTQEELAKMLNVSLSTVNRWEKGHFVPTTLVKIKLEDLFKENDIEEYR